MSANLFDEIGIYFINGAAIYDGITIVADCHDVHDDDVDVGYGCMFRDSFRPTSFGNWRKSHSFLRSVSLDIENDKKKQKTFLFQ